MSGILQQEVELLGRTAFEELLDLDVRSPHRLCGCVEISPHAGKRRKEEAVMTTFITERFKKRWTVEQKVRRYPTSRKLCDRVVELSDGSLLWLEIKLTWKSWHYDEVYVNRDFFYQGYFGGAHHSHSASGDFDKMETITAPHGSYVGFLLIGFDDNRRGTCHSLPVFRQGEVSSR